MTMTVLGAKVAFQRPSHRQAQIMVAGLSVALLVSAALALSGLRHALSHALAQVSVTAIVVACALHVLSVVARANAWGCCLEASCGKLPRRSLLRATAFASLLGTVQGQLGTAARIAILRRSEPQLKVGTLVAAEIPIILVQVLFGALMSFTLAGPLGLPWWVPALALIVVGVILVAAARLARAHERSGGAFWQGISVLRSCKRRNMMIVWTTAEIMLQIARTWVLLAALGVRTGPLGACAVILALGVLAQLPLGAGGPAGAAMIVLSSVGVASAAAAGVLLSAVVTVSALILVLWAGADLIWRSRVVHDRLVLLQAQAAGALNATVMTAALTLVVI